MPFDDVYTIDDSFTSIEPVPKELFEIEDPAFLYEAVQASANK